MNKVLKCIGHCIDVVFSAVFGFKTEKETAAMWEEVGREIEERTQRIEAIMQSYQLKKVKIRQGK